MHFGAVSGQGYWPGSLLAGSGWTLEKLRNAYTQSGAIETVGFTVEEAKKRGTQLYTMLDSNYNAAKATFLSSSQIELIKEEVLKMRLQRPAWLKQKEQRRPASSKRKVKMRLAGAAKNPFTQYPAWLQRKNLMANCRKLMMYERAVRAGLRAFLLNTTALGG